MTREELYIELTTIVREKDIMVLFINEKANKETLVKTINEFKIKYIFEDASELLNDKIATAGLSDKTSSNVIHKITYCSGDKKVEYVSYFNI